MVHAGATDLGIPEHQMFKFAWCTLVDISRGLFNVDTVRGMGLGRNTHKTLRSELWCFRTAKGAHRAHVGF
jgi:hypothetical protein